MSSTNLVSFAKVLSKKGDWIIGGLDFDPHGTTTAITSNGNLLLLSA